MLRGGAGSSWDGTTCSGTASTPLRPWSRAVTGPLSSSVKSASRVIVQRPESSEEVLSTVPGRWSQAQGAVMVCGPRPPGCLSQSSQQVQLLSSVMNNKDAGADGPEHVQVTS